MVRSTDFRSSGVALKGKSMRVDCVHTQLCNCLLQSGLFCVGTREYGVPGNENDESIVCMSVGYCTNMIN